MINSIRKFCFMIALLETAAIFQITLFWSMAFHYNADQKKDGFPSGPWPLWTLQVLPVSMWGSSGTPVSPHVPRMCVLGERGCHGLSEFT